MQTGSTTLDLAAVPCATAPCNTTTDPLTLSSNIPVYLVPSDTTAWSETASTTGTEPIQFDSSSPAGDPDVSSTSGTTATASLNAVSGGEVTPGEWSIAPLLTGAFGSTGGTSEPVTTSMTATTAPFDSSVSAATGDLWLSSTDASYSGFAPVTVNPGDSATIPVMITPTGASATTDTGTLYLDDTNEVLFDAFLAPNADQVAAFPYSYSVTGG